VLGVDQSASDRELRRAYRRKLRQTHPDTGGDAAEFDRVQRAWDQVGSPQARAAYDLGSPLGASTDEPSPPRWATPSASPRTGTRPSARTHGHPGGWYREQYLELLGEWVGRGVTVDNPYDVTLVRSAPREIQHLLASAVAEEETAVVLAGLGIGFTVWHDVRTDPVRRGVPDPNGLTAGPQGAAGKLDHIVLGPTGLWGMLSEDWGERVTIHRGELVGPGILADERPMHELGERAKRFAREARVKFSALVIVVPDGASQEAVAVVGTIRGARAVVVERSRLAHLVRTGVQGVTVGGTDLFDVRTRIQAAARFV
jgi:hypothetical protein